MRRLDTLLATIAVAAFIASGAAMALTAPLPPVERVPQPSLPPGPAPHELIEGTVGPILTLDPQFATSPAEVSIAALLFRGLTRLGPAGAIEADLADAWEVDAAGTTWTFFLGGRDRWHDRVLVSADDVLATVATLQDPAFGGPGASDWRGVGVERIDRFTVRFRLPVANAAFLAATTRPLVPAHRVGNVAVVDRPSGPLAGDPVGNGPFRFVQRTADEVVLERFGGPPGGMPSTFAPHPRAEVPQPTPFARPPPRARLDLIRFRLFQDAAELADAFATGEVDAATGLPSEVAALLAEQPGVSRIHYPGTRVLTLVPNLRFADRQLRDAAVRRALSTAIDRERIVDQACAGSAAVAGSLVPEGWALFDPVISGPQVHDTEAASGGLVAGGWTYTSSGWDAPEGEDPVRLDLVYAEDPARPDIAATAESVAEDWRALGILVDIEVVPAAVLVEERIRPGAFDVALVEVDMGIEPDLYPLLSSAEAVAGGSNVAGYQSTIMDGLLSDARLHADQATRAERWRDLQAALMREMPLLPLVVPATPYLIRDTLAGPTPRRVPDPGWRYHDVLAWATASGPNE